MCGHRGVAARAPENTLAGVAAARRLGLVMIEVDLRLTADDKVVLHHDEHLGRTVAGRGRVGDLPLAALRGLDAGSWFDAAFAAERVPTLRDLLAASGPDLCWNLELKTDPGDEPRRKLTLVREVLRTLDRAGVGRRALLTSFDHGLVAAVAAMPGAPRCGLIFGERPQDRVAGSDRVAVFSMRYSLVDEEAVRRAHAAGVEVHAWTVNDDAGHERMKACGVDVVISDDPGKLLS